MKTINKCLIKYDIPHRRNLSIIKIIRDKNGRFTFGISEKPTIGLLSHYNDSKIDPSKKEEKPKAARTRKVCTSSNNNLAINADKQKENQNNEKFD